MQASANITTGIGMPSILPCPRRSKPSSPELDRIDVGAEPGLPQQEGDRDAGECEHHDRHRYAEHIALSEALETVEPRAPLHDVELEQRRLAEAGEK